MNFWRMFAKCCCQSGNLAKLSFVLEKNARKKNVFEKMVQTFGKMANFWNATRIKNVELNKRWKTLLRLQKKSALIQPITSLGKILKSRPFEIPGWLYRMVRGKFGVSRGMKLGISRSAFFEIYNIISLNCQII